MERSNIANAVHLLEDMIGLLDNAYWEASKAQHKDVFHNLLTILSGELNELAKLSIEDHYMAYEPITADFRNSHASLKHLQANMTTWVLRSRTAQSLEASIPNILGLLHHQA